MCVCVHGKIDVARHFIFTENTHTHTHTKPNMPQSLHSTILRHGQMVEIQIRTDWMHAVLEMGLASHWLYKDQQRAERSYFKHVCVCVCMNHIVRYMWPLLPPYPLSHTLSPPKTHAYTHTQIQKKTAPPHPHQRHQLPLPHRLAHLPQRLGKTNGPSKRKISSKPSARKSSAAASLFSSKMDGFMTYHGGRHC